MIATTEISTCVAMFVWTKVNSVTAAVSGFHQIQMSMMTDIAALQPQTAPLTPCPAKAALSLVHQERRSVSALLQLVTENATMMSSQVNILIQTTQHTLARTNVLIGATDG